MTTRRSFLTHSSVAAAALAAGVPRQHLWRRRPPQSRGVVDPAIQIDTDPAVRTLALRAIEAAKSAGATYADVRLTRTLTTGVRGGDIVHGGVGAPSDSESCGVGVRALVNGFWGFAASPYWTPDEVVLLAHDAVAQAKSNALGTTRPAELGTIPVAQGSWRTPVRIDPFTVPLEEREEVLGSMVALAKQATHERPTAYRSLWTWRNVTFQRQEQAVATSDGAYFTQTFYAAGGDFGLNPLSSPQGRQGYAEANGLGLQALGWEMYLDADIPGQIPRMIAEAEEQWSWTTKPGDVDQYDVVFDAASMTKLITGTLGSATQLDTALGYEAAAGVSSYLDDPFAMVGTYQLGSPLLTLTANRSMPTGLATVKWDNEGVLPEEFTLVKDGVLVDFQTTRESAQWLKEYYAKIGKPVRSHGCAESEDALFLPMQHMPNLVMAPGKDDISFDDLVKDTKKGLAVIGGGAGMDWQSRTGIGGGSIREIVNGRLGARIANLQFLFSSSQIWKNLVAVGGPRSAILAGAGERKGQPAQGSNFTVSAVPAKVTKLPFVDLSRMQ